MPRSSVLSINDHQQEHLLVRKMVLQQLQKGWRVFELIVAIDSPNEKQSLGRVVEEAVYPPQILLMLRVLPQILVPDAVVITAKGQLAMPLVVTCGLGVVVHTLK
eukprot:CAMPEP_0178378362 /NCGR_PEP_ID=MMETSP0689_2-20121128/4389_1 /TAXON_ID=160604 /ORGANISM="Amphidinium massartii, Strain CS-259" /LENGTH=104 /DNA_ID=CAMNT_0019998433 /DNA_START=405 /DNA_END=719 /DNA_ORIENTATION=+